MNKCGNVLAQSVLCWWVKDWNCDKKIKQSADNIMEGQKDKNGVIAMVSDPAVTLYGFIKFLKDYIMKLIFAT